MRSRWRGGFKCLNAVKPCIFLYIRYSQHTTTHRTRIYLQDAVYETLKQRARSVGVSVSELIRRTLEKDLAKDPVADARAYFARLKPLQRLDVRRL